MDGRVQDNTRRPCRPKNPTLKKEVQIIFYVCILYLFKKEKKLYLFNKEKSLSYPFLEGATLVAAWNAFTEEDVKSLSDRQGFL